MSIVSEIQNSLRTSGTPFSSEHYEAGSSLEKMFGTDITKITSSGNVFLCASVNAEMLKVMLLPRHDAEFTRLQRTVNTLMSSGWSRASGELQPIVILEMPEDAEAFDEEQLEFSRYILEQSIATLTFMKKVNEQNFTSRIPALFHLDFGVAQESNFMETLIAEGSELHPAATVQFVNSQPGLAVISGGNGTGKTMVSRQFPVPDDIEVPEGVMQQWRRAIGYGMEDGSLLMPIAYEGNGVQCMDRLGLRVMSCIVSNSGWPGIVLDTPFTGISELYSFKCMEVIARVSMHRQVVLGSVSV